MINVMVIIFLYGCIWIVPIAVSNRRRKKGLKPYWFVFIAALIIEIVGIYFLLSIFKALGLEMAGLYCSPVISGILAGYFYVYYANRLDKSGS